MIQLKTILAMNTNKRGVFTVVSIPQSISLYSHTNTPAGKDSRGTGWAEQAARDNGSKTAAFCGNASFKCSWNCWPCFTRLWMSNTALTQRAPPSRLTSSQQGAAKETSNTLKKGPFSRKQNKEQSHQYHLAVLESVKWRTTGSCAVIRESRTYQVKGTMWISHPNERCCETWCAEYNFT